MFLRVLSGLVGIALGVAMVAKTEGLVSFFGRIDFFDRYLGSEGGTRLGYKLIGLAVIFISMLIATGLIGGFLTWFFGPLLKFSQPPV